MQLSPRLRRSEDCRCLEHWCPGCRAAHVVPIRPYDQNGWYFNGDFEQPTVTPDVVLFHPNNPTPQICCHYRLEDGVLYFFPNSDHDMAGRTEVLPDLPGNMCDH